MRPCLATFASQALLVCASCRSRSSAPSPAPSTSASAITATTVATRFVMAGAPQKSGEVVITLENGTDSAIELETELVVERIGDAGWEEIFTSGLRVRASCDATVAKCITLAPHASLRPPPWLGMEGDAQCACKDCATARPGRYRFLARRCDGSSQLEGEPFDYAR